MSSVSHRYLIGISSVVAVSLSHRNIIGMSSVSHRYLLGIPSIWHWCFIGVTLVSHCYLTVSRRSYLYRYLICVSSVAHRLQLYRYLTGISLASHRCLIGISSVASASVAHLWQLYRYFIGSASASRRYRYLARISCICFGEPNPNLLQAPSYFMGSSTLSD